MVRIVNGTKSPDTIRLTFQEFGRLQFSIGRQLVPIFTFFGSNGAKISTFIFLTPKGTSLAGTTYNDVLRVGVSRDATCGRGEETKKRTNFHASNWLFTQTTYVATST